MTWFFFVNSISNGTQKLFTSAAYTHRNTKCVVPSSILSLDWNDIFQKKKEVKFEFFFFVIPTGSASVTHYVRASVCVCASVLMFLRCSKEAAIHVWLINNIHGCK